jgi:hypothetical protein
MKKAVSVGFLCLFTLALVGALPAGAASPELLHPRPSGYSEPGAPPGPQTLEFEKTRTTAGVTYDLVAKFPKGSVPEFDVTRVAVNGAEQSAYLVLNQGVIHGRRHVHGTEDFSVFTYVGWKPGQEYRIEVEGTAVSGEPVRLAQAQTAPAERSAVKSLSFATPTAEDPYHHAVVTLAKEGVKPGIVQLVEVDGLRNRDARVFNEGATDTPGGESYNGAVDGEHEVRIVVPVDWTNGSEHTIRVTLVDRNEETRTENKQVVEATGKAPARGGYWNADWPHSHSLVLSEHAGIARDDEPVKAAIALFADEITAPEKEIRVVTYNPRHPEAGPDGYVQAPFQILAVNTWNDPAILAMEEKDAVTGESVQRFDATTTVELVFLADVAPHESRVYQVLYGNPNAPAPDFSSALKVSSGEGLSQTIENGHYRYVTTPGSGAVDTITILGEGEPVLLEHHVETNGAIHWNPEFYSPPTPWVHASDWGTDAIDPQTKETKRYPSPEFSQHSGPVLHRTERFAPLPEQEHATVSITYEFFSNQPYTLMSSLEEVKGDHFVQALRNNELVFNKDVFNEFVWLDPEGKVQSLDLTNSRMHPVHAIEIPAETPWMAFINRERKVGFASINLEFVIGNRYGKLESAAQPYIYVQNGPWFYFSRPIVYPFGGKNQTRMMPVRDGSFYYEKAAWLPFRLADGDDPFAPVEQYRKQLSNPLHVVEWMRTNPRTPEHWVMPILTQPFDEGVEGAVSAHKPVDTEQQQQ